MGTGEKWFDDVNGEIIEPATMERMITDGVLTLISRGDKIITVASDGCPEQRFVLRPDTDPVPPVSAKTEAPEPTFGTPEYGAWTDAKWRKVGLPARYRCQGMDGGCAQVVVNVHMQLRECSAEERHHLGTDTTEREGTEWALCGGCTTAAVESDQCAGRATVVYPLKDGYRIPAMRDNGCPAGLNEAACDAFHEVADHAYRLAEVARAGAVSYEDITGSECHNHPRGAADVECHLSRVKPSRTAVVADASHGARTVRIPVLSELLKLG